MSLAGWFRQFWFGFLVRFQPHPFFTLWPTLFFSVWYCVVVATNRFLPEPILLLTLSRECPLSNGLGPFDVDAWLGQFSREFFSECP